MLPYTLQLQVTVQVQLKNACIGRLNVIRRSTYYVLLDTKY